MQKEKNIFYPKNLLATILSMEYLQNNSKLSLKWFKTCRKKELTINFLSNFASKW